MTMVNKGADGDMAHYRTRIRMLVQEKGPSVFFVHLGAILEELALGQPEGLIRQVYRKWADLVNAALGRVR